MTFFRHWPHAIAVGMFVCSPLLAQDPPAANDPPAAPASPAAPDRSARAKESFSTLDANADGQLEASEVPEQQQGLFKRLVRTSDKDADGKLSLDEFTAGTTPAAPAPDEGRPPEAQKGKAKGNPAAMFARLDKNGDGKVTIDEIPEQQRPRIKQFFGRADADKDGALTKEELERLGQNVRQQLVGRPARPGGPSVGPLFAALDADGDGNISSQEISAAAEALKKLDRDGDGAISRAEATGAPGQPAGAGSPPNGAQLLERLFRSDANQDGKLSEEELPAPLRPQFKNLDANGDGFLDKSEVKAMASSVLKMLRGTKDAKPKDGEPKKDE
jgi:Ca2+-binding EF-hand superfamily protein